MREKNAKVKKINIFLIFNEDDFRNNEVNWKKKVAEINKGLLNFSYLYNPTQAFLNCGLWEEWVGLI